jgi:hypothetical protein
VLVLVAALTLHATPAVTPPAPPPDAAWARLDEVVAGQLTGRGDRAAAVADRTEIDHAPAVTDIKATSVVTTSRTETSRSSSRAIAPT